MYSNRRTDPLEKNSNPKRVKSSKQRLVLVLYQAGEICVRSSQEHTLLMGNQYDMFPFFVFNI